MYHPLYIDIDSCFIRTSHHIESRDRDTHILSHQVVLYEYHQRPAHHARTTDKIRSETLVCWNHSVYHTKYTLRRDQYHLCLHREFSIVFENDAMVCDNVFRYWIGHQEVSKMDKTILHKNPKKLRPVCLSSRFFFDKKNSLSYHKLFLKNKFVITKTLLSGLREPFDLFATESFVQSYGRLRIP